MDQLNAIFCIPGQAFAELPRLHAVAAARGVFVSFLVHDYFQELLVRRTGGTIPWTMTIFEFLMCTVGAAVQIVCSSATQEAPRSAPSAMSITNLRIAALFALLSTLLLASLSMGTFALKWVSFPVKVVLKSSKLLPAMIMGVLLLKKKYSSTHYLAATLLCSGVVGVTFANEGMASSTPVDATSMQQTLGITLTLLAVCCDAVSPVIQEFLLRQVAVPPPVLMVSTNGLALLGVAVAWIWCREWRLWDDAAAAMGGSDRLAAVLFAYGSCSYMGIAFLLLLISTWGSAIGVAVTTLRKVVTVVISFLVFPKQLNWQFAASGVAVLASIVLTSLHGGGGHGHGHGQGGSPSDGRTIELR